MQLRDGSIIPSYLGIQDTANFPEPTGNFENYALRMGEVREIIYPDDPKSVSKKYTEYRVVVQYRDDRGMGSTTEYPNCALVNVFGGIADRSVYTLRPKAKDDTGGDGLGEGSKVVILCVNGETPNALIIGGVRDSRGEEPDPGATDGHYLLWEFNGLKATINKDGELEILFQGATQANGKLVEGADAKASGTTITFKKDGSLVLAHDAQSLTIDHTNKNMDLVADQLLNMTGPSGVGVNSDGTVKITSAGTKIGGDAAVDALVMGTTFRAAQKLMHAALQAGLNQMIAAVGGLAGSIAGAAGALTAAAAALASPGGASAAAGPVGTAGGSLMAAGPALTSMAAGLTAAVQAIATFEAGADTYLSKKNTTD